MFVLGKGNKERIALIGDVTKEIIKIYLNKHGQRGQ